MGAPITAFEVVESIKFFAQVATTEGLSDFAKNKANEYIDRLIDCLEPRVRETIASQSGLTLIN